MKRADHHLVQQVLDGDIGKEGFDAFQQRLREEPELVELYESYAILHHTLSEEIEGGFAAGTSDGEKRFRSLPLVLMVAAVMVLAVAALYFKPWNQLKPSQDAGIVTFSVDAVWQITGTSRILGGATGVSEGGVLRLMQGRAGISLEPSVTAVIEGPAELAFGADQSLHLAQGRGYFYRGGTGGSLTVSTPKLTAVDSGTAFGVEVSNDRPDEIHVISGTVNVAAKSGNQQASLKAGDSAKVDATGEIELLPTDGRIFPYSLGRFRSVLADPFDPKEWRVDYGAPSLSGSRIDGANYSVFRKLPVPEPAEGATVLLATLEVGKPTQADFHTDGWAGMSFYSKGNEVLFFGDSFGTRPTWSLDVKQRVPVILPEQSVIGPRAVTMRYDFRSGLVTLHDGGVPLKAPFCEGTLPPGIRFDEIRIGASAGASLVVNSLEIRVGGD
jgi:hypothetical protein